MPIEKEVTEAPPWLHEDIWVNGALQKQIICFRGMRKFTVVIEPGSKSVRIVCSECSRSLYRETPQSKVAYCINLECPNGARKRSLTFECLTTFQIQNPTDKEKEDNMRNTVESLLQAQWESDYVPAFGLKDLWQISVREIINEQMTFLENSPC